MLNEYKASIEQGSAIILDITEHSLLLDISSLSADEFVRYVETDTSILQTIFKTLSTQNDPSVRQKFNKAQILAFQQKHQQAIDLLTEIENDVIESNHYLLILHLYEVMAKLNERIGDYSLSYSYYLDYFTLDKLFPDTDTATNFKMLLQSINFFAKGKAVIEEIEKSKKFDYSRFDQALMKAALYEKMGKYKEVSKSLQVAKKYINLNTEEKKNIYFHVVRVIIDMVTGITNDTVDSIHELEMADLTTVPENFRIKILRTLAVYYLHSGNTRKFVHNLNVIKKTGRTSLARLELLQLYSHYLITHFQYKKVLPVLHAVVELALRMKNELHYLNSKILLMNIQLQEGDFSFLSELEESFNFDVFLKYNNKIRYVEIVNNYAQLLAMFGKYEKALEYTDKIITITRIHNLSLLQVIAQFNYYQLKFTRDTDETYLIAMKDLFMANQAIIVPYYQEMMLFHCNWYAYYLKRNDIIEELQEMTEAITQSVVNKSFALFFEMLSLDAQKKEFIVQNIAGRLPEKAELFLYYVLYSKTGDVTWLEIAEKDLQNFVSAIPENYRDLWLQSNFEASIIAQNRKISE